ncbi:YdeI/OmpD-associated family protein [Pelagicoccus mobilis]|uniref:YdeI/OmpD-associated family protein n=1 Tax=Pelagicoccus mobilis TaxID=415221 RepID=A0A934RW11_9BACT|nr:YdeI/OmpD-associated family protein [Pelagicoccus mobilis]MBK1877526.1 YdeI/OmpD-associated family protein [Pelagicoccus mobilis]
MVIANAVEWAQPSNMQVYKFKSRVVRVDGAMNPHGIPIPDEVSEALWESATRRLLVRVNGYELRRGLQGSREFGSHIVVGLSLLREAGASLGDAVKVEVEADPNANGIDVCDELLIALEQDKAARDRWESLTLGKQRGLAYHVGSAKREETRIKRALDIAEKLRTGTLSGD